MAVCFQLVVLVFLCLNSLLHIVEGRKFWIDYETDTFQKDGQPYRYVSGSMHYFRVPRIYWKDRMSKMRYAGLTAVETYVEWNSHEPEFGQYDFTGNLDIGNYLETAQSVGLDVILRLGPYIDAERDMGGFPYWLLTKNPNMVLRSRDPSYFEELVRWYAKLLPLIKPYLYANGGPIITVQIENEYGYSTCDFKYTSDLRDLVRSLLGDDVVLFTTDGALDSALQCAKIDTVFSTIDFGPDSDPSAAFSILRNHQANGPLVNSEYYVGWLDFWAKPHMTTAVGPAAKTLDKILALNASVNFYMFHGGTSFGFGSGAYYPNVYSPTPTSYDYDAPLSEAGDPTEKFFAFRDVIGKYLPLPDGPTPLPSTKMEFGPIYLTKTVSVFDHILQSSVATAIVSEYPLTFEELGQAHGFVYYVTTITVNPSDPTVVNFIVHDRAQIFVDGVYQLTVSRVDKVTSLPINAEKGSTLGILVENQGRVCTGPLISELKGIVSNVTFGPTVLTNWRHYKLNLSWESIMLSFEAGESLNSEHQLTDQTPMFYSGNFILPQDQLVNDTFLQVKNWSKGVAFVNGFNLGRYWPQVGPQQTLYLPASLLNPAPANNTIVLFELQASPCGIDSTNSSCTVSFVSQPVINATTPFT